LDFPNLRGFVKEKIGKEKIMSCFWKEKKNHAGWSQSFWLDHSHFGWHRTLLGLWGPFW